MGQISNYERYPNNVFLPQDVEVDNKRYKYYLLRFDNLSELYDYLKGKPKINESIFRSLSSRNSDERFAGMPYEEAVEDLISIEDPKYIEFVDLIKDFVHVKQGDSQKFQTVYTLAGGHLNVPLYSAGVPQCYETEERIKQPKFIKVHSALSYSGSTQDEQIFNRAVILISIINALEKRGYSVNINAFEMSSCQDEIVNNVIGIKKFSSKVNLQTLYKTSFKKEFLRRILFGVLETVDVNNAWGSSYGKSCSEAIARQILDVKKDDIYFGTPQELGITGTNLENDFHTCLKKLKLDEIFNVRQVDEEFRNQIRKLAR